MDPLIYFIGIVMPYISLGILIGGLIYRFVKWLSLPVPVRIPLTPAPITRLGVIARLGTEFIIFRSLSKANKKLWFSGYLFHVLLGITFIVHLFNIYLYQNFTDIVNSIWFDRLATFSGLLFGFSLAYLILRRVFIPNIRLISKLSDYIILILIFILIFLGNYMRAFGGVNLDEVRNYMISLLYIHPTLPPNNIFFLLHYIMAMIFFIYIPFSKVAHLIGWFLAPTRNMRNISRYKRHINPWNDEIPGETMTWEEYYKLYKDELDEYGPEGERK